jgi:hypothetical protein
VQRALLGMIGFVLVVAAFALYFASHNALAAFYDAVLVDGVRYSGAFSLAWFHPTTLDPSLSQRIPVSLARFLSVRPQWPFIDAGHMWPFVGAIVVLPVLTLLRPSRWVATIWMWLFAALLAVLVGPAGENHYLVMTLPAVALTVGIACELIWPDSDPPRRSRQTLRLLCGIAIAAILYGSTWREGYAAQRSQVQRKLVEEQARQLGQQIRAAAQPGDRLFVEDEPLQIYLYAGVAAALHLLERAEPRRHHRAPRGLRAQTHLRLSHARQRAAPGKRGAPTRAPLPMRSIATTSAGSTSPSASSTVAAQPTKDLRISWSPARLRAIRVRFWTESWHSITPRCGGCCGSVSHCGQ